MRGFYNLPSSFANSSGVSVNESSGEYSAMTVTLHTNGYYVHERAWWFILEFTDFAESALLPRVHNTAHAQDSNSERACGGAEILTHLLLNVKETAQKYQSIENGRCF